MLDLPGVGLQPFTPPPALFLRCQMRKGGMLGGESVGAKAFVSTVNSPGLCL